MTIEISDEDTQVRVTYRDGDGNTASAFVVGASAAEVKDRVEEIVDAHNLKEAAGQ
jgi:hypothetical protein